MLDPKETLEHRIDYPKISAKNRRSLGDFIIAWGVLESELDTCFISLFRVNPTLCGCITANLGTKAKLDILSSALSMLEEPLGSDLVTAGHEIIEDTRYYSAMARNTLAHGQPYFFAEHEEDAKEWVILRYSARKKLNASTYPMTSDHWDYIAKEIKNLAAHWRDMSVTIHEKLSPLNPEDFNRVCEFGGQSYSLED